MNVTILFKILTVFVLVATEIFKIKLLYFLVKSFRMHTKMLSDIYKLYIFSNISSIKL